LVTNIIFTLVLLVIFVVLRKNAWRLVNRIARKSDVDRWTHLFFSFTSDVAVTIEQEAKGILNLRNNKREDPDGGSLRTEAESPRTLTNVVSTTAANNGEEKVVGTNPFEDDYDDTDGEKEVQDVVTTQDSVQGVSEENGSSNQSSSSRKPHKNLQQASDDEEAPVMVGNEEDEAGGGGTRPDLERSLSSGPSPTFWQWLKSIFTASDDYIYQNCGDDALQYLRFERHVIFYLFVVMVISVCVILPINFQGTLFADVTSFEHTTLANLDPSTEYLWVHLILAFMFFPVAILVMRRFSVDVRFTQVSLEMSHTVMIENIPKMFCRSSEELRRHFAEAFPQVEITDLRFGYDVAKLQTVHQSLNLASTSYHSCAKNKGKEVGVYDVQCSRYFFCFCCCCAKKHQGLEFYEEETARYAEEFEKEKEKSLRSPLGIAFVTFKTLAMSKEVYDAFRRSVFQFRLTTPDSSLSSILKPEKWRVQFAPEPTDIYWENLSVSGFQLKIKYALVNILVLVVALFLTTPEVLLTQLNTFGENINIGSLAESLKLPSWITDFLPTLLIWSFTALLPVLVSWSDRFLGHWTRSAENHSIMKKVFWYLIFVVVFLPTFGFTSARAAIEFFFNQNSSETYRWECIFLPDSGAFFVNYAITAAFVGAGLELVRLPELLWYVVQLCWSRSSAESTYIRNSIKYEFRFGEQYARIMMMFCMTIMYSVSCPLITPFGTLYFVTKHYVDRHNLMYAYKPSKINKKVHATAIGFVILGTVILQFFMMIFSVLRGGNAGFFTTRSKISIVFFLLSVNIYLAQLWADTCRKFSPIEYLECIYIQDDSRLDPGKKVYLPETLMTASEKEDLKRRQMRAAMPGSAGGGETQVPEIVYGTFSTQLPHSETPSRAQE